MTDEQIIQLATEKADNQDNPYEKNSWAWQSLWQDAFDGWVKALKRERAEAEVTIGFFHGRHAEFEKKVGFKHGDYVPLDKIWELAQKIVSVGLNVMILNIKGHEDMPNLKYHIWVDDKNFKQR